MLQWREECIMTSNMFRREVEREVGRLSKPVWTHVWKQHNAYADDEDDQEGEIVFLVSVARDAQELEASILKNESGKTKPRRGQPSQHTDGTGEEESTIQLHTSPLTTRDCEYAETVSLLYAAELSSDYRVQRLRAFLCSGQVPPALPASGDEDAEPEYEGQFKVFMVANGHATLSAGRARKLLNNPVPCFLHPLDYSLMGVSATELCGETKSDGQTVQLIVNGENLVRYPRQAFRTTLSVPTGNGGCREVAVRPSSVLGELSDLSRDIAEQYGWKPAGVTWFILTGASLPLPGIAGIDSYASFAPARVGRPRSIVTMRLDHWVSPDSVAAAWRAFQLQVTGKRRHQFPARRTLQAIRHCAQRWRLGQNPTWLQLMESWNAVCEEAHRFEDVRAFSQTMLRTYRRLRASHTLALWTSRIADGLPTDADGRTVRNSDAV